MYLDKGSDIVIVNDEETWKYINKPKLSKSTQI